MTNSIKIKIWVIYLPDNDVGSARTNFGYDLVTNTFKKFLDKYNLCNFDTATESQLCSRELLDKYAKFLKDFLKDNGDHLTMKSANTILTSNGPESQI